MKDVITNEIYIELDREKIEREGLFDYDDLVNRIDTSYAESGFTRDKTKGELRYRNSEPNNFLKQCACYARIAYSQVLLHYIKEWYAQDYKNNDYEHPTFYENILETYKRRHSGEL